MKNLVSGLCAAALLLFSGLACKIPRAGNTGNSNRCALTGEPTPRTSQDFVKRAERHRADSRYATDFNQCAFEAALEAVALDPGNAEAYAMRGSLFKASALEEARARDYSASKNSFVAADNDLSEAIRLAPKNHAFYQQRSLIYEEATFLDQNGEKFLSDLTKSIEIKPTAWSHTKRGDFYADKKNHQKALEDYTQAIKLDPYKHELYTKRGMEYFKLGKSDLGFKDQQKSSELMSEGRPKESSESPVY